MASNPSAAGIALVRHEQRSSLFTGSSIADQMAGETEEERKKRLAAMQASQQGLRPGSVGQGYSAAFAALGGIS